MTHLIHVIAGSNCRYGQLKVMCMMDSSNAHSQTEAEVGGH